MRTDKNSIDAQLAAIEVMKSEFLKFFNGELEQTPDELRNRNKRITESLDKCGGKLDGYWVSWLFNALENKANEELRKVVLLAQTTEPDKLKEKHFPDLNNELVNNVKKVNEYLGNKLQRKGVESVKNKKHTIEDEVIYRAKYFLDNPEKEYKDNVDKYRSTSLARAVIGNWSKPLKITAFPGSELWENNTGLSAPTLEKAQDYIKNGVKKGCLPNFVVGGKPRWKD